MDFVLGMVTDWFAALGWLVRRLVPNVADADAVEFRFVSLLGVEVCELLYARMKFLSTVVVLRDSLR